MEWINRRNNKISTVSTKIDTKQEYNERVQMVVEHGNQREPALVMQTIKIIIIFFNEYELN